jgi:V/A-type H+-transporting ATPase subunit I
MPDSGTLTGGSGLAVERMEMLNIIGHLDDMDFISRELVLLECIHMVNAMNEIESNNFTISTTEKNMGALVDVNFIRPYREIHDHVKALQQVNSLLEAFGMDKEEALRQPGEHFDFARTVESIDMVYKKVESCLKDIETMKQRISRSMELRQYFSYIEELNIPWQELRGMEYFYFRIGLFPKENMDRLRNNYDNTPAIVYPVHMLPNSVAVISIAPKSLMVELDRIYNSLGYQSLNIPDDYKGTPKEIIRSLEDEEKELQMEIEKCNYTVNQVKNEHGDLIEQCYSELKIYEKMEEINKEAACSNDFFYMSGWIPVRVKERLEKRLKPIEERTLLIYKDPGHVNKKIKPPTNLKNFFLVRPFEALVNMYGTPAYNELDPTSFVGISYMLLFGAMFGDLGQGLLFFLTGLFLTLRKSRPNLGGVATRLGISSMVFGALYGSVFGFEDIIPAVLVRPMQNINTILIAAIVLGVVLLTAAFIYGLVNAWKRRDVEEGLLGRNGLVGLIFFWTLLIFVLLYMKNGSMPLPLPVMILILGALLALMVVRQPLANWLMKKKPLYHESAGDYYIEEGFGLLETLLSMLSNTISFVRVGAFALNHVGLFVAFQTMADMINNAAGSVVVLIIGNVVIIGLEGLIVFIQGLRLEYYELFSKYYDGSGIPYHPVRLDFRRLRKKRNHAGEAFK